MKFYVITPISTFLNYPRIREFQATMFHGLAEREGKYLPDSVHFVYANTPDPPILHIARTFRRIPDISKPGTNLVVCEPLAQALRDLPGLRIVPVTFTRLVDVEYRSGDHSWWDQWGPVEPQELLRTLPDVREAHDRVGPYFEVQCWRWRDVVEQYSGAAEVAIEVRTPPMVDKASLRLSADLMNEHPVLKHGDLLLSERAFEILEPGFDWEYFIARSYDLPGAA